MADDVKFVFIATGVDGGFFTKLAARQVVGKVRLLSKNKHRADSPITPPATIHFVHFNFEEDKISFYKHSFAPRGRDDFSAAIKKNPQSMWSATDPDVTFVTKSNPISIVDVYHAVRNADPRQSVLEVDLYSHGFLEGPVLANTDDPGGEFSPGIPKRDEDDRDGRSRTDFFPNMGEDPSKAGEGKAKNGTDSALTEFLQGFSAGASFRVFGCNVQDVVATVNGPRDLISSTAWEVVRQAFDIPFRLNTSLGAILRADTHAMPASVILDMRHECELEVQRRARHRPPLPVLTTEQLLAAHASTDSLFDGITPAGTIECSYMDIVRYVARHVVETYVFTAADALPGVTCFGAVPGTSGERELPEGDERTMHVRDFVRYLKFFARYLDISSTEANAPRQRRYGIFDTATVARVKSHETNG